MSFAVESSFGDGIAFKVASCWAGHYNDNYCCDPTLPNGNPDCWDDVNTFERCCQHTAAAAAAAELRTWDQGPFFDEWPPRTILGLSGIAGPLTHLAGTGGNFDFTGIQWFGIHLPSGKPPEPRFDFYSRGSTCTLELAERPVNVTRAARRVAAAVRDEPSDGGHSGGRSSKQSPLPRWFAGGSNCKPYLHCPLWVPLAVAVIDRAASMSLLLWLAVLDGRTRRTEGFEPAAGQHPTLQELWDSLAVAYDWGNIPQWLMNWIGPEHVAVGLDRDQSDYLVMRLLQHWHSPRKRGRPVHLPPHLCYTCCQRGTGRMSVVFVRSPFARLVSFFRLDWLGNDLKAHNRWQDFPLFVQHVTEVFDAMTIHNNVTFHDGFNQNDALHTRAISEWMEDATLREPLNLTAFHVLHVEHLISELSELSAVLCRDQGYCKELPPFPRINTFSSQVPSATWAACWADNATTQHVLRRYRQDFDWFGYAENPVQRPSVEQGLARISLPGGLRVTK